MFFDWEQCSASYLFRCFQWFSHVVLKVTFCTLFLPLWNCNFYMCLFCVALLWVKCWLPWWQWDKRSLFQWHYMGWQGYIWSGSLTCAPCLASVVIPPNYLKRYLDTYRHLVCRDWDKMLATLVSVGQALLVPVALHGLAGVYLKR